LFFLVSFFLSIFPPKKKKKLNLFEMFHFLNLKTQQSLIQKAQNAKLLAKKERQRITSIRKKVAAALVIQRAVRRY
jgi:hypothetical protein